MKSLLMPMSFPGSQEKPATCYNFDLAKAYLVLSNYHI